MNLQASRGVTFVDATRQNLNVSLEFPSGRNQRAGPVFAANPPPSALVVDQPQAQLVQLGAEQRVHVLDAEGRLVSGDAAASRPGGGDACFPGSDERFLQFPDRAGLQELQETFAPRTAPGLGAVLAIERHLEDGLQTAGTQRQRQVQAGPGVRTFLN